jgi:hypothetical protein
MKFDPKKPKVSLRRFTDPIHRLAIRTFMLNKGTQAEAKALENTLKALAEMQQYRKTDYRC